MAYIGVQPTAGQYRKLDNISASFNGSTTSFTTSVGGTNVTAGTAQQLIVSLGGVIQQPDTDYTVSTNTITFTTAPTSGLDFFAILMGDALNTVTPSDGSVTTAKLAGSLSVGLAAGSVSAPSLFFTGDTNNGIFSPSTDAIAVTTAGSERLRVTSTGLVGIGTSSPSYLLDASGSGSIGIRYKGTGAYASIVSDNSSATGGGSFIVQQNGSTKASFAVSGGIEGNTSSDAALFAETGGAIRFYTNGSPTAKAILDSTGRVGIGTSTFSDARQSLIVAPASGQSSTFLTVKGSSSNANTWLFFGDSDSDSTGGILYEHSTDAMGFRTSAGERARIDSSGRLLIGTSTARANMYNSIATSTLQLEAVSATTGAGRLSAVYNDNSADGTSIIFGKSRATTVGGSTVVQSGDALGSLSWQGADGSELVEAAFIRAEVDGTPGANDMPGRLVFSTTADGASSPTERMRIHNGGCVSVANGLVIGSLGAVTNSINISGSVIASGAGNSTLKWNTSSGTVTYDTSSRLVKNHIVDCPYGVSEIKQLQPRKYFRTDDQREEIGFIADEMIQVMPEFVPVGAKSVITKDENDTEQIPIGVNYEKLTAVLVKALQEAVAKIESLEARLTAAGI